MALFNQMLEAQQRFQFELLAKSGVVGVAIGYREVRGEITDEMSLVALVQQKMPIEALTADDLVPREVDGVPVDVFEVGYIQAQSVVLGPRDRWRPVIPGGVSIGHRLVTAGTLGAMVKDRNNGQPFILSNNHVIANSNDANTGDAVLQPAPTDGGLIPQDVVAQLERFERLRWVDEPVEPTPPPGGGTPPPGGGTPPPSSCDVAEFVAGIGNLLARLNGSGQRLQTVPASAVEAPAPVNRIAAQTVIPTNSIDAALARPINPEMFSPEILGIGLITGTMAPRIGQSVRKSGRTTGLTTGIVTQMNAVIDVGYQTLAGPRTARFTGQTVTTGMSQGGDSGSLIVDAASQNAVGLLFAGSGTATIFTPIDVVLNALGVSF